MEKVELKPLTITGIAVRTTNREQQSAGDIARLWEQFWKEDVMNRIPDKAGNDIYCIYTEYEGDFTQPYTTLIGCGVDRHSEVLPAGMKFVIIPAGNYMKLTARGRLADGVVIREWSKVWESNLPRTYQADFEVYPAGIDMDNAEIGIFVGIK